jgi:hypothetical protein
VPFGTGASIAKLSADKSSTLLTYNILAFKELRTFFELIDIFFESEARELNNHFSLIPQSLRLFLGEKEWIGKMIEIKNNTSGLLSFKKRFFGWFNMFRIVKYLNFVHTDFFEKRPVDIAASELLEARGMVFESNETKDLLLYYRSLERASDLWVP